MSMNVSISDSLEGFVQEQVQSGLYSSASEVVRAGLRLLREREVDINKNIAISLEQIRNGECSEMNDEFWQRVESEVLQKISDNKKV